jgi:hypothetical protein
MIPRRIDPRPSTARRVAGLLAASLMIVSVATAQSPEVDESQRLGAGVVEEEPGDELADDGLPSVVLATFTTEISEREPVDDVSFLGNDKRVVYFFTDLRNMQGQTIRHVWSYAGNEMGTVSFEVKGKRWRAWSSKQLLPAWLGEWSVSVLSPDDEVLATESFTYQTVP